MKSSLILLIALLGFEVFAQSNCPQGHCSRISERMNKFCIANGMAGKPYLVLGPHGEDCYCPCSCVTEDTHLGLLSRWRQFGQLDGTELAATPLGQKNVAPIHKLYSTDLSDHPTDILEVYFDNGDSVGVSSNHTFITPDKRIVSAKNLRLGQAILAKGFILQVTDIEPIAGYRGKLMNLSVNPRSTNAEDHVIYTNGVASGDFLLQSSYDQMATEVELRMQELEVMTDE